MLITHKSHVNKLALILSKKTAGFRVLVLCNPQNDAELERKDLWWQILSLAREKLFAPSGSPGHTVLTVSASDIFEISAKSVKLDPKLVEADWDKRQQDRFKFDPPGQTCSQAVHELLKLTVKANETNKAALEFQHFISDLKVNEQNLYHSLTEMYAIKDRLLDHLPSTRIPNFEEQVKFNLVVVQGCLIGFMQFAAVFERKFLEEKKSNLEFRLSNASLTLYPDYRKRIELLQKLGYVDANNTG